MWAIISNAFQLTEETEIESEGSAGCKSIRLKNNNNIMLQSVYNNIVCFEGFSKANQINDCNITKIFLGGG